MKGNWALNAWHGDVLDWMTEVKMLKVGSPRYPQSSVADRDHSLYQNSIVARPYVWLIQSLISTSLAAASSGLKCFHVLKLHW